MPWTASIAEVNRTDTRLEVMVLLSDGTEKWLKRYDIQPTANFNASAWITGAVRDTVARLDQTKDSGASLTVGTVLDLTPPVVTPPEDPDPALTAFRADFRLLEQWQRAIATGAAMSDPTHQALLAKVQGAWDVRFIGDL